MWARARAFVADTIAAIDEESGALRQGGLPDRRATVVLLTSVACLVLLEYGVLSGALQSWASDLWVGSTWTSDDARGRSLTDEIEVVEHLAWAWGCVVIFFVVPALVTRVVLREPLAAHGLTSKGYLRHARVYALLFAPAALAAAIASTTPGFREVYPFFRDPPSMTALVVWELSYGVQFLALEFFYRGFMLHGLKHRYGSAALWIMAIPYMMIHFPKPMAESVGALVAGLVLGVLSLRTGSILGGATIHVAIAWWMDLLASLPAIP